VTPFTRLVGRAVALHRANIDTDQIIPARFLRRPRDDGYNNFLFHDLRAADPQFPLRPSGNPPLIVADDNFGCGSSREGAVYALADAGIRCVIAPGFGDIFASNAAKNGVLAVVLPAEACADLRAAADAGQDISVDLPEQTVRAGNQAYRFEIDGFRKQCLIGGLDDIALTLANEEAIAMYEANLPSRHPWALPD
jgi:3-isopropylmalate/(R)-2-methylmalate dehydratase small subunit